MTALRYKSRRRPVLTLLRDVAEPAPGSARWLADAPDAAHPHGPRVPAAQDAGIRVRYGPAARPLPDAGGETHPRVPAIGELLPASSVPPAIWRGPGGGTERLAWAEGTSPVSGQSSKAAAGLNGSWRSRHGIPALRSHRDPRPPAGRPVLIGLFFVMLLFVLSGCATNLPPDALRLSPETLEHRELQTRRFEGLSENEILAASAGVLQDLGFNLDESETELGVLVASKQRSARDVRQVATAMLIEVFIGWEMETDERQRIRASLVSRPTGDAGRDGEGAGFYVRITFQRMVWDSANEVSRIERLDEPELYQGFFDRLSKSVFLEAHKI